MSTKTPNTADRHPHDATSSVDKLSRTIIDQMEAIFGKHPGYRTTHAKGLLVEGKFTPTSEAKTLSTAPHFTSASTPIVARFSIGGGIPHLPDADPNAGLKGFAVRFLVDDNTHTDLIAHTYNGFVTKTGEDFSHFLQLLSTMNAAQAKVDGATNNNEASSEDEAIFQKAQTEFFAFLGSNKAAAEFAQAPPSNPHDYGTITYYEVNTHVLTNADGTVTNVRYRLQPADGEHRYNNPDEVSKLAPNYLEDDLKQRFPHKPVVFTVQAHIADIDDILDDATIPYKSKTFIQVGKIEINKIAEDNAAKQQHIAFSPRPEKGGIKGMISSEDPLIQIREGVYYISRDQRRQGKRTE